MKKLGKFSFVESGILLIILGAILLFASSPIVYENIIPLTNISELDENELYDGMYVRINIDKNYGICYYDTSLGLYGEMKENSKEYSRAYLVENSYKNRKVFIPVEVSEKRYVKLFDSNITNVIDAEKSGYANSFVGIIHVTDPNRKINAIGKCVLGMEMTLDDAADLATDYYILLDDPVDDFIKFISGVIAVIIGIIFIVLHELRKKKHEKI